MSLASFHYAFTSRDELLDVLITEVLAKEERALAPSGFHGKTLSELLAEGLRGYLRHLQADPSREQAMLELAQFALRERPQFASELYEQYTRIAMGLLEVAAEQTDSRWTVPLATVARMLITFTDGLTITWLVDRDSALAAQTIAAAASAVASLAEPA